MAEQLSKMDYGGVKNDIVIIIDNNEITKAQVRNAFANFEVPANKLIVHQTGRPGANEYNIGQRRRRIVNNLNTGKRLIPSDSDFVFMMEDDTAIPENALTALLMDFETMTANGTKVGLISGVQPGRWGFKIVGAWNVDNPSDMKRAETVKFNRKNILEKVDAAGFYCFITPAYLFEKAKFIFNQFGADVNYGLALRKAGYGNYIDWTVDTGHVMQHKIIRCDESCVVVRYEKLNGKWKRTLPTQKKNA